MDRRSNALGFIRVVLAGMVVYAHAFQLGGFGSDAILRWSGGTLSAGGVAVQAFFVLSGRLVAESWIRLESVRAFAWHRTLRIAPGLWACLVVVAFFLAPIVYFYAGSDPAGESFLGQDPSPTGYVWRNLLYPRAQIVIGGLLAGNPFSPDWNGPLWTLPYEVGCYAFIGVIGAAGLLGKRARAGEWLLTSLLAIFVVSRALPIDWLTPLAPRIVTGFNRELAMLFMAGALWAVVSARRGELKVPSWVGAVALALLVALWAIPWHTVLSTVLMPPAIFWLATVLPFRNWEARVGGDLSYGIYIYGWPAQQVLAALGVTSFGLAFYLAASLVVTTALAWISWKLVESRALKWKALVRPAHRAQ